MKLLIAALLLTFVFTAYANICERDLNEQYKLPLTEIDISTIDCEYRVDLIKKAIERHPNGYLFIPLEDSFTNDKALSIFWYENDCDGVDHNTHAVMDKEAHRKTLKMRRDNL